MNELQYQVQVKKPIAIFAMKWGRVNGIRRLEKNAEILRNLRAEGQNEGGGGRNGQFPGAINQSRT